MSERDLPNMDDVELPDIPDDDELDSADEGDNGASTEGAEPGQAGGGRFGPLLARLAPILAMLGPLLSKVGAAAAPLAKVTAPIAKIGAPVAKATAPVVAIAGPLVARVPRPILAGVGSFAGVLVVIVLLASVLGGGRGAAEASAAAVKAPAVKSSSPLVDVPKPTPKPAYTPTPSGPTATPTPAVFVANGKGWVVAGNVIPNPRHRLIPDRMLFFDDGRDTYRVLANLTILMRSGPLAPLWGIVLAYQDEANHLRLEFFADSYDQNRPYAGLFLTKNDVGRLVGSSTRLPNLEFWGRDTHEIVVEVDGPDIIATINGDLLGQWKYEDPTMPPVKKGLYVWGPSRIRFDSVKIE